MTRTLHKQFIKDNKSFTKINKNIKGISQNTTCGITFLNHHEKEKKIKWPVMNVNDSVTKCKFDNLYGAKHSTIDGINRAIGVSLAGKKVLVIGYGDVGKGCVQSLKAQGARIYVAEIDPICALQACLEGYQVITVDDGLDYIDIYVCATGNKIVIST